ncbi:hypothetical protein FE394_06165 [Xenorhabdus sp. Reich]|uniref:Uncharacterized protein n=1 Tax=Xenorhabdus littoralis TaxID=2582835 RepID=A0ABU4SJF7_9GAMM|nr:hypothetical protein [Xenorhabdus sp. Reich]MDX7998787.1 hypothetical protein [Xenorhabdus sp. Reich]
MKESREETSHRDFIRAEREVGREWHGFSPNMNELTYFPNGAIPSGYNRYPCLKLKFRNDTLLELTYCTAPRNSAGLTNLFGFLGTTSSNPPHEVTLFTQNRPWLPLHIAIGSESQYYNSIRKAVDSVLEYWHW